MIRSAKILTAKGVPLPEWSEDLWASILKTFLSQAEGYLANWKRSREFYIPISDFFEKKGIFVPNTDEPLFTRVRFFDRSTSDSFASADYGQTINISLPKDFFDDVTTFRYILDLFKDLYGTFVHELIHMLDPSVNHKDPRHLEKYQDDYAINSYFHAQFPKEWRAYLGEIRSELKRANAEFYPGDNVVEFLQEFSPEWRIRARLLPEEGRKYILSAIGTELAADPKTFARRKSNNFVPAIQSITSTLQFLNLYHDFGADKVLGSVLKNVATSVSDLLHVEPSEINSLLYFTIDGLDGVDSVYLEHLVDTLNKKIQGAAKFTELPYIKGLLDKQLDIFASKVAAKLDFSQFKHWTDFYDSGIYYKLEDAIIDHCKEIAKSIGATDISDQWYDAARDIAYNAAYESLRGVNA